MSFRRIIFIIVSPFVVCPYFIVNCSENPTPPEILTGTISGKVTDYSDGSPLANTTITTVPITSSVNTNNSGDYSITDIQPGTYAVSANKSGYQENTVVVDVEANRTTTADIALSILTPTLSVSPTYLDFGTSTTSLPLTVQNGTQVGTLTWAAGVDQNWMSVSPTSGSVTDGLQQITVTVDRTDLEPGNNYGTLSITSNGGNQSIGVVMVVHNPNAPQLSVDRQHLDFDSTTSLLEVTISNTGTGTLTWSLTDDQTWITVNPTSGSINTTPVRISVMVDRAGMDPGDYNGGISISSNGGNVTITVAMSVSESGAIPAPALMEPDNITQTSMDLAWTRITDERFLRYRLYRSLTAGVNESSTLVFETVNSSQNTYSDQGLMSATTYYYRVYVYDIFEQAVPSNEVSATTRATTGVWSAAATIDAGSCYSIYMLSDNEGYAVGYGIWRWDGTSWAQETTPDTMQLYTISFSGQNDGWAGGGDSYGDDDGILYHYNGIQWVDESSNIGNKDVYSIEALSNDNIWIGCFAKIYHYEGTNWQEIELSVTDIDDIDFISPDDGWLVGRWGKVYHYNGMGWGLDQDLYTYGSPYGYHNSLSFSDANNGWVSSGSRFMHRFFNGQWSLDTLSQNTIDIRCVFALSSQVVFAGGDDGKLFRYDSNGWEELISPTYEDIRQIYFVSNTSGWAITDDGTVLRYQ